MDGKDWMRMEQYWNGTDWGNWSSGRKNSIIWVVEGWKVMDQFWIGTDWEKKFSEKNIIDHGFTFIDEYGGMVEWYSLGKLKYSDKEIYSFVGDGWELINRGNVETGNRSTWRN